MQTVRPLAKLPLLRKRQTKPLLLLKKHTDEYIGHYIRQGALLTNLFLFLHIMVMVGYRRRVFTVNTSRSDIQCGLSLERVTFCVQIGGQNKTSVAFNCFVDDLLLAVAALYIHCCSIQINCK